MSIITPSLRFLPAATSPNPWHPQPHTTYSSLWIQFVFRSPIQNQKPLKGRFRVFAQCSCLAQKSLLQGDPCHAHPLSGCVASTTTTPGSPGRCGTLCIGPSVGTVAWYPPDFTRGLAIRLLGGSPHAPTSSALGPGCPSAPLCTAPTSAPASVVLSLGWGPERIAYPPNPWGFNLRNRS